MPTMNAESNTNIKGLNPKHFSEDTRRLNPDLFPEHGQTRPRRKPKPQQSNLEARFEQLWRALEGPQLEAEYRFHHERKWRMDFAHVPSQTAIELEGGIWNQGRHTRGSGFVADAEKYATATLMGWTVFRLPGPMITMDWLRQIMDYMKR